MTTARLIHMGDCYRPHGLRGGFKLSLFNREESQLHPGQRVYLKLSDSSSEEEREFIITDIHFGNQVICYLKGIEGREGAEALVPFSLFVRRSDFRPQKEGEGEGLGIYLVDLPGMKVLDQKGKEVGIVLGTYHNGAHGILEVRWEGETMDIPLVSSFVVNYSFSEGWIKLLRPELIS